MIITNINYTAIKNVTKCIINEFKNTPISQWSTDMIRLCDYNVLMRDYDHYAPDIKFYTIKINDDCIIMIERVKCSTLDGIANGYIVSYMDAKYMDHVESCYMSEAALRLLSFKICYIYEETPDDDE